MSCINRDKSPATCCCGCSLTCGIITVGVLEGINLVINIFALNTWGIIASVAFLIPIVALAIWKESKALRFVNFLIQAIILGAAIVGLLVWVICIDGFDLPGHFCGLTSISGDDLGSDLGQRSCEKAVRLYMYVAWAIATVLALPLQFLIMQIFKAYHDELKDDS